MDKQKLLTIIFLTIFSLLFFINLTKSCNEMVCASVVSKCMLTQSCKCDLKNCSCCKECFNCLGYLYNECCSCVDMCPKPNETRNALSKKSHVEVLEGIPGLFNAITEVADNDERWLIFTFPVDFDSELFGPKINSDTKYFLHSTDQDLDSPHIKEKENIVTVNCTVLFMSQCMSWNKCKESCSSMGASSFRWFHDSCCECVGNTCINYGINDSRCKNCPDKKDDGYDLDEAHEDDLDYGEGMEPLDGSSIDTNI